MAHILSSIEGSALDSIPIQRALLSVSDKTGLLELAQALAGFGVHLLSTGGTAKTLRDAGLAVTDVSEYTGFPEILDGRVKTLHPKVHGALLAVRGNAKHEQELAENGIGPIDLVVMNLYPFQATVESGASFSQCMENIDIGGPCMLRSAAKNHAFVTVLSNPAQYQAFTAGLAAGNGCTTLAQRRQLAGDAFAVSAAYDTAIAAHFAGPGPAPASALTPVGALVSRRYEPVMELKYGINPHQKPSVIYRLEGQQMPFKVVNGKPGYINLLDALNAWQLVQELSAALHLPAAASFKHVSPAGAAVGVPLDASEAAAYELGDAADTLSPTALAYLRARNADPLCSFGDFVAISDIVDASTAGVLKHEVCDGIIAPGYSEEALAILTAKKKGSFIILQADPAFIPCSLEYREVYGMAMMQARNEAHFDASYLQNLVSGQALPADAQRDLILASIVMKYTQSNSVGYAKHGQMVGVGAGQQSRVDCVKLAARKLKMWYLRQHPKVLALPFKKQIKRQERVNARVRYIEGDMTANEMMQWIEHFESPPDPLTDEDKALFLTDLQGVCLSSDAFFPFRDSIDHAAAVGVEYIAQPGGSVADAEVIAACEEYGITMAFTGLRLFHH